MHLEFYCKRVDDINGIKGFNGIKYMFEKILRNVNAPEADRKLQWEQRDRVKTKHGISRTSNMDECNYSI